jgi:hypothetical protein
MKEPRILVITERFGEAGAVEEQRGLAGESLGR